MSEFRRFIISIAGGLELLFVVGFTLVCGLIGLIPGSVVGGAGPLIGFVIGGFVGFCISALMVNISVNLAEIAKNTQRAVELLEGDDSNSRTRSASKNSAQTEE